MIGKGEKSSYLSLYIHVPFCAKKCPYCHFYVQKTKNDAITSYLEALKLEILSQLEKFQDKDVVSIYFGGGTPSQLSPVIISNLLEFIQKLPISITSDCEITMEANPEDLSKDYLAQLSKTSINRLSLGVQSLDENLLKLLGREHSAQKAIDVIETAFITGFKNISIDLMYELPFQTVHSFKKTLKRVQTLPITHLSLYNLTIEPKTVFYKNYSSLSPHLPKDIEAKKMLDLAVSELEQAGLNRYEISAFCKDNFHSRHNTGYWLGRDFLGFGPSAFSYYKQSRYQNICHLKKYTQKILDKASPVDFHETLDVTSHIKELVAIRLRLLEGLEIQALSSKYPFLEDIFEKLKEKKLLIQEGSHIALSEKGLLFYDDVGMHFV